MKLMCLVSCVDRAFGDVCCVCHFKKNDYFNCLLPRCCLQPLTVTLVKWLLEADH